MVVTLGLSPQAAKLSKELTAEANKNISLMGLTEGKFQKFFSNEGVIFVEKIDVENQRVENIFANIYHPDRIDTLTADYGYQFVSAFQHKNIWGAQFHPEKSHRFGMHFLKKWLELC